MTAITNALAKPELIALSHVNLQIDNAYFWRESEESDRLECGLLDWYNLSRAPAVSVWGGCLSGCDPDVLLTHEKALFRAFSDEYKRHGGPRVDASELLLLYHLSIPGQVVGMIPFITSEIYPQGPSKAEWPSIKSVWDPRIMGQWQCRCRVVALLQLCRYWHAGKIHSRVMEWVKRQRPEIDAAAKP